MHVRVCLVLVITVEKTDLSDSRFGVPVRQYASGRNVGV